MDLDQILEEKQPPPGGVFQLRARIHRRGQQRHTRHRVAYGLTFAALLFGAFLGFGQWRGLPAEPAYAGFMHEGSTALGLNRGEALSKSTDANAALIQVSNDDAVVIYQYIALNE